MSLLLRVTLDETLVVENPAGWEEILTEITQDDEIRGLVVRQASSVSFIEEAFDYLYTQYKADYCNEVTCLFEIDCGDGFEDFYDGIIKLKDVSFDVSNCAATVEVLDNSYLAKIKNYKKVAATLSVGTSRNNETITAVTPIQIEFLNPDTGGNYTTPATNRDVYKVYDCFRFLIDYMTDGEVGFESDYFDTGGGEFTYITDGLMARDGTGNAPRVSFEDLFDEMNKIHNIAFVAEVDGNGDPIIRIEQTTTLFDSTVNATFEDVNRLEVSTDLNVLYSAINVGADPYLDSDDLPGFTGYDISFIGFIQENYTVLGECAEDNALDLINSWILDSNTIQDIVGNDNDAYDDNIMIIQVNAALTQTDNTEVISGVRPYNYSFNNENKITRWFDGIPNSVAQYFSTAPGDEFIAENTTDFNVASTSYAVVPYNNTVLDPGGNYNNGLYRYVIPTDGYYAFLAFMNVDNTDAPFRARVERRDSGGTLLDSQESTIDFPQTGATLAVYCNATDYIQVQVRRISSFISATVPANSRFESTLINNGNDAGGIYTPTGDALKFRLTTFRSPLTIDEARTMIRDPKGRINVTGYKNITTYGWIRNLSFTLGELVADTVLFTDDVIE